MFLRQLNKHLVLLGRSRLTWLLIDLSILYYLRLRLGLGLGVCLATHLNKCLFCPLRSLFYAGNLGGIDFLSFCHLLAGELGNVADGRLWSFLSGFLSGLSSLSGWNFLSFLDHRFEEILDL